MAVMKNPLATRIVATVEVGMDPDTGEPITRNRTFNNVVPNASIEPATNS